jgi:Bacterial membrane protein YfhO
LRADLFESREPFLKSLYLGLPALFIGALGLRSRASLTLLAGFAFFVAASLGRYSPLYAWLLALPGVGLFRYPVKYMLPASLIFALALGKGLAAWQTSWNVGDRRLAARVMALAAVAALAFALAAQWLQASPETLLEHLAGGGAAVVDAVVLKLRLAAGLSALIVGLLSLRRRTLLPSPPLTAALLALSVGDLVWANRTVNPLAPTELFQQRPPILSAVATDGRILVLQPPSPDLNRMLVRGPAGWEQQAAWALGLEEMLVPPIGARFGLHGSYDGDVTGLAPPRLSAFSGLVRDPRARGVASRLLELGNVDHVVALEPGALGLQETAHFDSVFSAPIRVFRVRNPLPFAYLAAGTTVESETDGWRLLVSEDFDPSRRVVLAHGGGATPLAAGNVLVVDRRPDSVSLDVTADQPAYAVVIQTWFPGWHARLDGVQVPIYEANLLFSTVAVPAGHHHVELRYVPPAALAGLVSTAFALLCCGVVWTRPTIPRRC